MYNRKATPHKVKNVKKVRARKRWWRRRREENKKKRTNEHYCLINLNCLPIYTFLYRSRAHILLSLKLHLHSKTTNYSNYILFLATSERWNGNRKQRQANKWERLHEWGNEKCTHWIEGCELRHSTVFETKNMQNRERARTRDRRRTREREECVDESNLWFMRPNMHTDSPRRICRPDEWIAMVWRSQQQQMCRFAVWCGWVNEWNGIKRSKRWTHTHTRIHSTRKNERGKKQKTDSQASESKR